MSKPKPPTDYWIWLAIAGLVLVMVGYCTMAPNPLQPFRAEITR